MKSELTLRCWIELIKRSAESAQLGSILDRSNVVDCNGNDYDLSKIVPPISFFTENKITILDKPLLVAHSQTDGLIKDRIIRERCMIGEQEEKLKEFSHVYTISLIRAFGSDYIDDGFHLIIRGVKRGIIYEANKR